MLQHAYGAGMSSIADDWQTELEQLLGISLVEATGAAAAAGDRPVGTLSHVIRTLARSITSLCQRSSGA